tara:strand:+ start:465 stop:872 length:408 start_codon:yes stop_codon:yes gene_type:complete
MSKHETPLTLAYWKKVKGTLIEEYPIVRKSKDCSPRWIDGLIIKGGEFKQLTSYDENDIDLEGKDLISIQTQKGRIGMYHLGQAFFTMKLLELKKPKSIESIAICTKTDSYMEKIIEDIPNLTIQVINPDTLEFE